MLTRRLERLSKDKTQWEFVSFDFYNKRLDGALSEAGNGHTFTLEGIAYRVIHHLDFIHFYGTMFNNRLYNYKWSLDQNRISNAATIDAFHVRTDYAPTCHAIGSALNSLSGIYMPHPAGKVEVIEAYLDNENHLAGFFASLNPWESLSNRIDLPPTEIPKAPLTSKRWTVVMARSKDYNGHWMHPYWIGENAELRADEELITFSKHVNVAHATSMPWPVCYQICSTARDHGATKCDETCPGRVTPCLD